MILPNIPGDFWEARPLFHQLRAVAHSRVVGADGMFWSYATSIASSIPARVAYDSGVGTPVRPTLFVALTGPSGTGKSTVFSVARSVLPPGMPESRPPSTGEGLVESYYGQVLREQKQPDGKIKLIKVRERVSSNAMFWLDEGETYLRQSTKPDSTIGPTLRSFWSGGTVGQTNASEDRRRTLAAGTYTGGLVIGLQPDISGRLLGDTATGTAQRFIWSAVTDTGIATPTPPVVRPRYLPPTLPDGRTSTEQFLAPAYEPDLEPVLIPVAPAIATDIRWHQRALRRGEREPAEQDTQRTAQHIKIAGALCWMDGRLAEITAEDWELAGVLLAASDAVRAELLEHAETVVQRERTARGVERAQVSQAEAQAGDLRKRCHERLSGLLGKLQTPDDTVAHRDLMSAVTTAQRPFAREALASLLDGGAVVEERTPTGGLRYRRVFAE
jgi:energy-coupling factor transporter ATP-binding protein EcfA2